MDGDRAPALTVAPPSSEAEGFRLDLPKLLTASGKILADVAVGTWGGALKSAFDLLGVVPPQPSAVLSPEQQGWRLVHCGVMRALAATIRDARDELARLPTHPDTAPFLRGLVPSSPFPIDAAFFDRPAESAVFEALLPTFHGWLECLGVAPERVAVLCQHLARELPLALDAEERANRAAYSGVAGFFAPSLSDVAATRERNWRRYRARLCEVVRTPLFNLNSDDTAAPCLSDLYIPLRGYWESAPPSKVGGGQPAAAEAQKITRTVVWLADAFGAWFRAAKADDAIRILSGDPGSGKSSFARMFAAGLARAGKRVLYVPLHRYDFRDDAAAALSAFACPDDELGHDPLGELSDHDPLLVIFDGLDELSKSGNSAGEAARAFVDHLQHVVSIKNNGQPRWLVLLAGRPVTTAASTPQFRDAARRLHVLRYVIHEKATPGHAVDPKVVYAIANQALRADQRDQWWQTYGACTGQSFGGLPEEYRRGDRQLDEITEQPLLNYLLALLRDRSSRDGATSVQLDSAHALYGAMFDYLFERIHKPANRPRDEIDQLSRENYAILMEEIAVAAWHTGDRAVTVEELEAHFKETENSALLRQCFGTIASGVLVVLNSFFIQPTGGSVGHCEFTHKSFREYLTARRLVRAVGRFYDHRAVLKDSQALEEWFALAGPSPVDDDLLGVLHAEVALRPDDVVTAWQESLTRLFSIGLREGVPPKIPTSGTFRQIQRQSRNAEEALLAVLDACARTVDHRPDEGAGTTRARPIVKIDWGGDPGAASDLLRRLHGQCADGRGISRRCLSYLNLSGLDLSGHDLRRAHLSGANLSGANLSRTNLSFAHLSRTNLSGANLSFANLSFANLSFANLSYTNISYAILSRAILSGAINLRQRKTSAPAKSPRTSGSDTP